ncbi:MULTISPECIES: DUF1822 family protein [unclassified Anabaena]|uniref:DUF1822 family protein n=1 Tax=unclassified Anabaena TaxID=2619674 RepID=UPI0039C65048
MNSLETQRYLTVPLGREAHVIAHQFATEQITPQKGKQIYLNTLAVYAVHHYLKWLQIDTNLSQSDSWHSLKRALFDVADLVLTGIGKIECRPVLPGETAFALPLEVTEDRIGYVAVGFSDRLDEAQLIGFVRVVDISSALEYVTLSDLQPLDTFLDSIPDVVEQPLSSVSKARVNLSQWLQNVFTTGWQTIEAMLNAEASNFAFGTRSVEQLREIYTDSPAMSISGAKIIDLGMQLAGQQIILIIKITPQAKQEVDIRLRVCPAVTQKYLPPNLQLTVWDEVGTQLQAEARKGDNFIQLEFSGKLGEHFSANLTLDKVSLTEDFVI